MPAGVQDAELHTYLKDGIALCKLLQTYKGGIRVHEQIKFKFHALDNLKVCNPHWLPIMPTCPQLQVVFFTAGVCQQCEK